MSEPKKSSKAPKKALSPYLMPAGHVWAGMWKIFAALAVVGVAMAAAGYGHDPKRFAFAYLTAFAWGFTLCMGALFFVLLQHLTSSGWSVTVRRGAEQLMNVLPIFIGLFIPILFFKESLYPWLGHEEHAPAIVAKSGFLNFKFWAVRATSRSSPSSRPASTASPSSKTRPATRSLPSR